MLYLRCNAARIYLQQFVNRIIKEQTLSLRHANYALTDTPSKSKAQPCQRKRLLVRPRPRPRPMEARRRKVRNHAFFPLNWPSIPLTHHDNRSQRAQTWSFRLHVLRQRAARKCERGEPGHQLWYALPELIALFFTLIAIYLAGQVGKVLGERWKALNPKQREPYEAKAKTDKERYESEKASYNVSTPKHTALDSLWAFLIRHTVTGWW